MGMVDEALFNADLQVVYRPGLLFANVLSTSLDKIFNHTVATYDSAKLVTVKGSKIVVAITTLEPHSVIVIEKASFVVVSLAKSGTGMTIGFKEIPDSTLFTRTFDALSGSLEKWWRNLVLRDMPPPEGLEDLIQGFMHRWKNYDAKRSSTNTPTSK